MSQPLITSQSPAPNETSVVLGHLIQFQFDQLVDPATVNESTFSVLFQGDSLVFDADNMAAKNARPATAKQHLSGTFAFPAPDTVVFTPGQPLRPKTEYTVIISGGSSTLAQNVVKNPDGEKLKQSYTWKFTTTDIDTLTGSITPVVSPLVEVNPDLPTDQIRVVPRKRLGTNFLDAVEIWFPDEIDPSSLDPSYFGENIPMDSNPFNDLLVSIEAINNDPQMQVPEGLTYSAKINKNVLTIQIQGWEN